MSTPSSTRKKIVWGVAPINYNTTPALTPPAPTTPAPTTPAITTNIPAVTTRAPTTNIPVGTEANTPTWTEYREVSSEYMPAEEDSQIDTSDQLDKSIRKYYDNYTDYLKDHTNTTYDQYVGNQILRKDDSASAYIRKQTLDPKTNKVQENIIQHENLIDYFIQLFKKTN